MTHPTPSSGLRAAIRPWSGWPPLLALLLAILLVGGAAKLSRDESMAREEAQVRDAISTARAQIDAVAAGSFGATANLLSLIRVQGELTETAFRLSVDAMMQGQPQLRNVVAAPRDVIAYVHPLQGNERALGLDYRSVPAQWAQIERARQLREPLLFAPVQLVQGGLGLVQRRPVFLSSDEGGERYWGTITAVADLERFVQRAGLVDAPIELALVERRADGQAGGLIWGPATLSSQRHLQAELQLPGAQWLLLGRPHGGWLWRWWQQPLLWGLILLSGGLVGLTAALTLRRRELLARSAELAAEVEARRLSQVEAEAARQRLQGLLATASDWYWEQDAELRLSFVAGAGADEQIERLRGSLGQRRWEQAHLLPGQPTEAVWAAHRATLARREPFRGFEYAVQEPGKMVRWYAVSGDPLFGADGEFLGYRGTGRDITRLRGLTEELQQTHDHLQALLDSATDVAMIATDLENRITHFSRGAERLLGYSPQQVLGSSPVRFHDPAEMAARAAQLSLELGRTVSLREVFTAELDGKPRPQSWSYLRSDGSRVPVSLTISELHDRQGRLRGHLGVAIDLSAQLAAQQELRATRDQLQSVLDAALDIGILVINLQGRIELFSKGAERLFGYTADEVLGRSSLLLHDPKELAARAQAMSAELGRSVHRHEVFMLPLEAGGGASFSHWTYVRKDGQRVPGAVRLRRMDQADGQTRFLAITMDISAELHAQQALERLNQELEQRVEARTRELARAQEELLRSERLAALGSLVAGVAHDLNTPLGTCMTAASTLHDRTRELREAMQAQSLKRSTLQAYVDNSSGMTELLLRGLRDAADLVAHFKQLSIDQTSEHRRRFRLASVVEDVLTVLRPQLKQGKLELSTEIALDEAVDGYPGELGRLLSNLIQNAQLHAEATRLTISARPLEGGWFEFVVADDGKGMSEEVRRRAFDPFFTTKLGKGGSGLGLNIVHNIATALLGGSVELISSPGKGSSFVFRLPLVAPRREPTPSRPGAL